MKSRIFGHSLGLFLFSCCWLTAPARASPYELIEHVIIISLENHSFDNLFGHFPGAEGLDAANATQRDAEGRAYPYLPAVKDTRQRPPVADPRFPSRLPNAPFPIESYVSAKDRTGDLVHRFYEEQAQINNGAMDRFAGLSDAGGLAMGYYDGRALGLWRYAERFTLMDHFFHAAFGGSMLNHFWMVCACTPVFKNAPEDIVLRKNENGIMNPHGRVTEDGFAVNTLFAEAGPHPADMAGSPKLMPAQTFPTIADRLEEKGVSWAWYAGGWNDALAGKPDATFQFHHQPFVYFKGFEADSPRRAAHLKDEADFLAALKEGSLPAVSFYKPLGKFNLHPEYADVTSGDAHITRILDAIEKSPAWPSTLVIVTFDENGGYWDHVPPPARDRFGPGVRVPTLLISPFAAKGHVESTSFDTLSILAFLEKRFGLKPLNKTDAAAADLGTVLVFP